jgi:hypothetical protein
VTKSAEPISRREFFQRTAKACAAGGASLGLREVTAGPTAAVRDEIMHPLEVRAPSVRDPSAKAPDARRLVWVWQFDEEGQPELIREQLVRDELGIILKTHDGTEWMSEYDRSDEAVSSPYQVSHLARFFEAAGTPFHAWCIPQGLDPILEARMAAAVLDAGARSLYLDLEPREGANYWRGQPEDALRFGEELRRLKPSARIVVAPDARPWQVAAVPLVEFVSFSNEIAPQAYWSTFDSPANYRFLIEHGYTIGPEGVTPELMIDVCDETFSQFGLPVEPIGEAAAGADQWRRFLAQSQSAGQKTVSIWRYGSADPEIWTVLHHRQAFPVDASAGRAS